MKKIVVFVNRETGEIDHENTMRARALCKDEQSANILNSPAGPILTCKEYHEQLRSLADHYKSIIKDIEDKIAFEESIADKNLVPKEVDPSELNMAIAGTSLKEILHDRPNLIPSFKSKETCDFEDVALNWWKGLARSERIEVMERQSQLDDPEWRPVSIDCDAMTSEYIARLYKIWTSHNPLLTFKHIDKLN